MPDLILSLTLTCFVTSVTPGPNNFIVLVTSSQLGRKKTLPTYLGVCFGFPLMVLAISILNQFMLRDVLSNSFVVIKFLGAAFMIYQAARIFFSKKSKIKTVNPRTSFFEMIFFQWMNPKAWSMVASISTFVSKDLFYLPSLIYFIVAFPSLGLWLIAGNFIRQKILGKRIETTLNKILAILLAASVVFILI